MMAWDEDFVEFPGRKQFQTALAGQTVAREIVELVVDRGGQLLFDHYLDSKLVGYSIGRCMEDMNRLMVLGDFQHGEQAPAEQRGAWKCEAEPGAPAVDTWARGAVPTKPKPPVAAADDAAAAGVTVTAPSGTPVTGLRNRSRASSKGRSAPNASQTGSLGATPRSARRGSGTGTAPPKPVLERPSSPLVMGPPPQPPSPTAAVRAKALAEQRERENELARRKAEEEKAATELAERNEKLAHQLRGKSFTYDSDGNVLIVSAPNTAKLPPQYYTVGVAVEQQTGAPLQAATQAPPPSVLDAVAVARAKALQPPKDGLVRKKGSRKALLLTFPNEVTFQESGTVQPPLVDTMTLTNGVKLREGEKSRNGPPLPENPLHMSRREFSLHQSMLQTQLDTRQLGMTSLSSPERDGVEAKSPNASTAGPMSPLSPGRSFNAMSPLAAIAAMGGDAPESPGRVGPADDGTAPGSFVDPDLELTMSPDWGRNPSRDPQFAPGVLPTKPNTRQRMETLGTRPLQPRDRPFVAKEHKKPPAPFPATSRFDALEQTAPLSPGASEITGFLTDREGRQSESGASVHGGSRSRAVFGRPTRQDAVKDRTGVISTSDET